MKRRSSSRLGLGVGPKRARHGLEYRGEQYEVGETVVAVRENGWFEATIVKIVDGEPHVKYKGFVASCNSTLPTGLAMCVMGKLQDFDETSRDGGIVRYVANTRKYKVGAVWQVALLGECAITSVDEKSVTLENPAGDVVRYSGNDVANCLLNLVREAEVLCSRCATGLQRWPCVYCIFFDRLQQNKQTGIKIAIRDKAGDWYTGLVLNSLEQDSVRSVLVHYDGFPIEMDEWIRDFHARTSSYNGHFEPLEDGEEGDLQLKEEFKQMYASEDWDAIMDCGPRSCPAVEEKKIEPALDLSNKRSFCCGAQVSQPGPSSVKFCHNCGQSCATIDYVPVVEEKKIEPAPVRSVLDGPCKLCKSDPFCLLYETESLARRVCEPCCVAIICGQAKILKIEYCAPQDNLTIDELLSQSCDGTKPVAGELMSMSSVFVVEEVLPSYIILRNTVTEGVEFAGLESRRFKRLKSSSQFTKQVRLGLGEMVQQLHKCSSDVFTVNWECTVTRNSLQEGLKYAADQEDVKVADTEELSKVVSRKIFEYATRTVVGRLLPNNGGRDVFGYTLIEELKLNEHGLLAEAPAVKTITNHGIKWLIHNGTKYISRA